jgi:hypothetical protein
MATELIDLFDRWGRGSAEWSDVTLDRLACRAFRIQYEGNLPYRKYCDARHVAPPEVEGWRDVPPVPSAAFRAVDLIVGGPTDAQLTFRTSGTTGGPGSRGRHLVREPGLYGAATRAGFRTFVLTPQKSHNLVTLLPTFTYSPDSSLGWMLDDVRLAFGGSASESVATRDGIDWGRLETLIEHLSYTDVPACVLGTTLAFAEWLERLENGMGLGRLPPGSKLVDTGGVKGRPDLDRGAVMGCIAERLSIPPRGIVNEFGMTELLSQRYGYGHPPSPLLGPPWLRTQVLDPVTLAEVPRGETGILCHFDLANLGSVCAVLTEDRGRLLDEGIEWLGRTPGAPPRGCSLATARMLEAQAHA